MGQFFGTLVRIGLRVARLDGTDRYLEVNGSSGNRVEHLKTPYSEGIACGGRSCLLRVSERSTAMKIGVR